MSAFGFSSLESSFLRLSNASFLMFILLLIRKTSFKINRTALKYCFLNGLIGEALNNLFYAMTINRIGLASAAILQYTAPIFVALISALVFHEQIKLKRRIALAINIAGCLLTVTGGKLVISNMSFEGIFIGFLSGFTYALMTIISAKKLYMYDHMMVLFYSFVFGSLFLAVVPNVISGIITKMSYISFVTAIMFGLVGTVLAYVFYMKGLEKCRETANIPVYASIETIVAALIGLFAFGQQISFIKLIGIMMVIASIFLTSKG